MVSALMGRECAGVGALAARTRVPGLVLVPFFMGSAKESGGNSHSEATGENKLLQVCAVGWAGKVLPSLAHSREQASERAGKCSDTKYDQASVRDNRFGAPLRPPPSAP